MLAGGSYQEILLWDFKEGKLLKTLPDPKHLHTIPSASPAGVSSVTFSNDGETLASVSEGWSNQIVLWNIKTGQPKLEFGEIQRRSPFLMKLPPKGNRIVRTQRESSG